ncbi:MAG: YlxR family protein [Stenomitos rutilans HA7619-LM2]|nr:YlxR family protein [Stenomitos rutilans HA7619-LM2]
MKPNDRRCVSCRKVASKQEFWRVVRVHSAQQLSPPVVQLDHGMGRSAYLCPQVRCLQAAQKKDRLGRVLKAPIAEQLYKTLWERLTDAQPIPPTRAGKQVF